MRNHVCLALACVLLCSTLPAQAKPTPESLLGPQGKLFEQALAQDGLTPDDLRFDTSDRAFWGGDKYRLPFYDTLQADPWKVSPYVRKLTDMLLSQAGDPEAVLVAEQSRLNAGIRLGLTGDPLDPYLKRIKDLGPDDLAVALVELNKHAGRTGLKPEDFKTKGYDAVPQAVRDATALVLLVIPDALEYRRKGLIEPIQRLGLDPQEVYTKVYNATLNDEENDDIGGQLDTTLLIEKLLDNVDFQLLDAGSGLLTLASERAGTMLQAAAKDNPQADFIYTAETPLGWVMLTARDHLRIDCESMLLNVALRGDDFYPDAIAVSSSYDHPVGVSIDVSGNDTYSSAEEHSRPCAAGIFGYGILLDLAGDDTYTSANAAQGYGLFGTGLLYDAGGNDKYTAITNCQGSAFYGQGLLIDGGGKDEYHAYQYAQGFGFTKSIGLLLDAGDGNDIYDANDSDIRFGGPQTAKHNTSMSQGMGCGRRADYVDGHSWAGGIGMLVDGGGDDKYSCGVFGQGCSYWYGTGILVDKAGNDSYHGIWYVQGAGAHFGLSVLQDDAGNDKYWASHNMAQGAGHDWTLAWFEDSAGDDDYTAPNLSLGGANANGIGVFWDKGGNDTYRSQGVTLGCAGGVDGPSLREYMLNLGVFIDGGGKDTYLEITKRDQEDPNAPLETRPWDFAGDGKAWTRPGQSKSEQAEYGVGVDAPWKAEG
jgi:hypothetical protein